MKDVGLGKARLQQMILKGEMTEEIPIMHVAGIAHDTKTGSGTYGEWTAMIGQFWAFNLLDQKEFLSRSCILPPLAQDLTVDAMTADGTGSVQFAYVITAVPDSSREQNGVKYGVRPVSEVKERDDVSGLKQLFGGTVDFNGSGSEHATGEEAEPVDTNKSKSKSK